MQKCENVKKKKYKSIWSISTQLYSTCVNPFTTGCRICCDLKES